MSCTEKENCHCLKRCHAVSRQNHVIKTKTLKLKFKDIGSSCRNKEIILKFPFTRKQKFCATDGLPV